MTAMKANVRLFERHGDRVVWLLCGDGPCLADVQRYVAERGMRNVRFAGRIDDVVAYLTTTVGTAVISGSSQTTTTIPTQVLGENFSKAPTSLANTGSPFSPALAVGLVFAGLLVLVGARHVSGRHLELSMRRVNDRER